MIIYTYIYTSDCLVIYVTRSSSHHDRPKSSSFHSIWTTLFSAALLVQEHQSRRCFIFIIVNDWSQKRITQFNLKFFWVFGVFLVFFSIKTYYCVICIQYSVQKWWSSCAVLLCVILMMVYDDDKKGMNIMIITYDKRPWNWTTLSIYIKPWEDVRYHQT